MRVDVHINVVLDFWCMQERRVVNAAKKAVSRQAGRQIYKYTTDVRWHLTNNKQFGNIDWAE
jgi:hypothetical protein